jgi:hypothetical protein
MINQLLLDMNVKAREKILVGAFGLTKSSGRQLYVWQLSLALVHPAPAMNVGFAKFLI